METLSVRWGICGAGKICHDFVNALADLDKRENLVNGVAARSFDKADAFAKKFDIRHVFKSYQDMFNSSEIDIIYIGVINIAHKSCIEDALNAGKHVLCEKPMCLTADDTKEVVALARSKKLFLMEGYWTRFFPATQRIHQLINNGDIGEVRMLQAAFCFPGLDESVLDPAAGGSTLMAIGVYCMMWANFIFAGLKPQSVDCNCIKFPSGVDHTAMINLTYPGNRSAQLMYSGVSGGPSHLLIIGTKSSIRVPDNFWCPAEVYSPNSAESLKFPLKSLKFETNFPRSEGFVYEAQAVGKCIMEGKTECDEMPLDESVKIAELLDVIKQKCGI